LTSWLRDIGVSKVPKQTPSGKKYIELEKIYLKAVPDGYSPAEWDLIVWKYYSNKIGNFPVPNAAFDVPN